jgi:alkylation response protein AidB-like acyl-CoA dehydrogenase
MIGPTILDYGTEAQKQRFLPPIARGEVQWCVGYSEPGAGSDLAALQTRCEDAGDHWLINGQKLWTSGADHADWCGCLVRTDPSAAKHDGISFVLVDMRQPGVEIRPIKLISGASSFCETFFNDALAAKDAILGKLNDGWTVGKRLLQHERAAQTGTTIRTARPEPISEIAIRCRGQDETGRLADPDLRARLVRHEIDARAHALTSARAAAEARATGAITQTASMLKSAGAAIGQERAELILEILGSAGGAWEGDAFSAEALQANRDWLLSKAMTVYGGTAEVQNNIIAKRTLGLPEATGSSRAGN